MVAADNRIGVGESLVKRCVGIGILHRAEHVGHRHLEDDVHAALEVETEAYAPFLHFIVVVAQPDGLLAD